MSTDYVKKAQDTFLSKPTHKKHNQKITMLLTKYLSNLDLRLALTLGRLITMTTLAFISHQIGAQTTVDPVNFKSVLWYAERAKVAYSTPEEILKAFPQTMHVGTVENTEVQYFIELHPQQRQQIITIRGTDNLANVREDAEYLPSRNPKLGIYVHSGFDQDAYKAYQQIQPKLRRDYETLITGHSLGAAISTLLMMYLHEDGYQLGQSINFGQPKITNKAGANAYAFLPLLRVVDENDPVPELPPTTLLDSLHGSYEHLGQEVILLTQQYYVHMNQHRVMQTEADSFWKNLGHQRISQHFIANYIHQIEPKLNRATQVSYATRESYITD